MRATSLPWKANLHQLSPIPGKPIGIKDTRMTTPVRTRQRGLQEEAGEGRKLTGSAHSFRAQPQARPGEQWDWKTSGVPHNSSTELQLRHRAAGSSLHLGWRRKTTAPLLRLGKSSNTPLFPQCNTPRCPTGGKEYSKQHVLAERNLLPRTDSVLLLLSYNIMKIWLIWTQDCKGISSIQALPDSL